MATSLPANRRRSAPPEPVCCAWTDPATYKPPAAAAARCAQITARPRKRHLRLRESRGMSATAFVHVSDLHIGLSPAVDRAAERLCQALLREHPGPVLLSGDVTHNGRRAEMERFRHLFGPLIRAERLIVVPGNHDRLGDDLGQALMTGGRVQAAQAGGLFIVRLDSTGEHNRRWLDGHGEITGLDIDEAEAALRGAPPGAQTILNHPLPLAHDNPVEALVSLLGWPSARELRNGALLLSRIRGLCDAVLHGHRHVPAEIAPWPSDPRPLRIFSAGSSTLQRSFRAFRSARAPACWIPLDEPAAGAGAPALA